MVFAYKFLIILQKKKDFYSQYNQTNENSGIYTYAGTGISSLLYEAALTIQ